MLDYFALLCPECGFHMLRAPTIGSLHTMEAGGVRVSRSIVKPDGVSFNYPLENSSRSKKIFIKIFG